jgi:hypothetical protein
MTAAAPPLRGLRLVLPVVLALALVGVALAVVMLAHRGRDREPPRPGAFTPPGPARPVTVLDVQQVRGGVLTLGGPSGSVEAALRPDVTVSVLRPAALDDIRPGDWVTLAGIPNEVLNFAIRQVVIIPADLAAVPDAEGVPRLAGDGFGGYEANRDTRERPLLSGRVERIEGGTVTFTGRAGTMTLEVGPGSPVQRLTRGAAADIRAGDRLAFLPDRPGAGLEDARAVLVLPAR